MSETESLYANFINKRENENTRRFLTPMVPKRAKLRNLKIKKPR